MRIRRLEKYVSYDEYKHQKKVLFIVSMIFLMVITITCAILIIFFSLLIILSWIMLMTALGFVYYTFNSILEGEIIARSPYNDIPDALYDKHRNSISFGFTLFAYWLIALVSFLIGIISMILIILYA